MNLSKNLTNALALTTLLTGLSFAVVSNASVAFASNNNNHNDHIKVTICHATHSNTNPYVKETVDDDAVDGNGNGNSDHNRNDHQNGEDIIPAGSWDQDGRNWNAQGQAIWNNDCNVPQVTPTATPTPTTVVEEDPTCTPTPTIEQDCDNECNEDVTPTPTTEQEQDPTPTPTETETKTEETPTPTPTTTSTDNNNGGTSTVQSATGSSSDSHSDPVPAKTMASTGDFAGLASNISLLVGLTLSSIALKGYEKKKRTN